MKANLYPALLALSSIFLAPFVLTAQSPFVSDSLQVFWEQLDGPSGDVFQYAETGGRMYAATPEGLYFSTDGGQNWRLNKALGRRQLNAFFADEDVLLAIEVETVGDDPSHNYYRDLKVWRSDDGGATWAVSFSKAIHEFATTGYYYTISHIVAIGASSFGFILREEENYTLYESADNGQTWAPAPPPLPQIISLTGREGKYSGLWKNSTNGVVTGFVSPTSAFNDFQNITIPPITDAKIVMAADYAGAFRVFLDNNRMLYTADAGLYWQSKTFNIEDTIRQVEFTDTQFFLRTHAGIWRGNLQGTTQLTKIYDGEFGFTKQAQVLTVTSTGYWVNTDYGQTICLPSGTNDWKLRTAGIAGKVDKLGAKCGQIYAQSAATYPNNRVSLLLSNAQDGEWTGRKSSDIDFDVKFDMPLGEWGGYLWAYSPPRLMRSHDCGANWDTLYQVTLGGAPAGITGQGNRLYIYSKVDFIVNYTDDFGETWLSLTMPSTNGVSNLIVKGDSLVAVPSDFPNKLDRSFDGGQTWETINITLPTQHTLKSIFSEGGKLIAYSWSNPSNPNGVSVFISLDLGTSWIQTFHTNLYYVEKGILKGENTSFPLFHEGLLFMHSNFGLHFTSDAGLHWTTLSNLPFHNRIPLRESGSFLRPMVDTLVQGATSYFVNDGYFYAATEAQGVWRTELAPIRDKALVLGGEYGLLRGQLYRDEDLNCGFNATNGDIPLGQKPLTVQPGNITAITDSEGKFAVALPPGNYTLSSQAPAYHNLSCNTGLPVPVTNGNTTTANLPFQPQAGIKDLCILFTAPVRARPGFLVHYKVQVNNVGTTTVSGATLTVDFDEQWLEPTFISPNGQFVGNQALIQLPDLAPGQVIIYTLSFAVAVNTPLDTELSFLAYCPVTEDANPSNNRTSSSQTVTGSFDPNDKTAEPVVAQLPYQPRVFDYLIRFQNTGTDTAFTVRITDTLDARFDLMSLRNVESSHPFEFRLLEGRVAKWTFRNILLPDSNINEVGSHGYVRFQIETKADALPGSTIFNDAEIFFDFNSPVNTNESAAENPKWVVLDSLSIKLCEGDTWDGVIWEQSATLTDTTLDVWTDTIVFTQIEVSPSWNLQFDTIMSAGQLLFGIPVLDDTTFILKLHTAEGCDSTILWKIKVLTSDTENLPGQTFSVVLFPNPGTHEVWLQFIGLESEEKTPLKISVRTTSNGLCQEWDGVEIDKNLPFRLNIEDLPAGIYFVEIQTRNFSTIRKLVKI